MTYHVTTWRSRDHVEPIKARNRAPTPNRRPGSWVPTFVDLKVSKNLRRATRDAIASASSAHSEVLLEETKAETILLRLTGSRCALRTRPHVSGAMASPEMFLSSPSRPKRRIATSPLVISSSPDLPSLQELGSRPPNPPLFKSTIQTAPKNERSRVGFTSAPDPGPQTVNRSPSPHNPVHESHYRSPTKPRPQPSLANNDMAPRRAKEGAACRPLLLSSSPTIIPEAAVTESRYFKKPAIDPPEAKVSTTAIQSVPHDASLNLELAPARRLDWTPPKQKPPKSIEPDSSDPGTNQPDYEETGEDGALSRVLESFKCDEVSTASTATRSDEDGSIFRKRKLIDAMSMRSEQRPPVALEPSNVKKKAAPKKKPRTITGLATAAYKLASQSEPIVGEEKRTRKSTAENSAAATNMPTDAPTKKTRKRTSKAPRKTKKKESPPKPILLSPSAALRQVANQDFLFGTSSQLALEQSPGFLRDLATAIKASNEFEYISLSTPINSDAVEPPEPKRSLWNAAARDEDGDLFDLGIQELVQKSQDLPVPGAQADPFGYVKGASSSGDDSFLTLSDALRPQGSPRVGDVDAKRPNPVPLSQDAGLMPPAPKPLDLPPRPDFALYTDSQLASEVSSYGFKNGKNQIVANPGTRSASTLTGASGRSPIKSGRATSLVKTPARPESSLASESQPQEPPPSAQQPMSPPKRPRGRPRKAAIPTPSLSESVSLCAAAVLQSGSTSLAPSTPKRSKAKKFVVEIPDSGSEADELDALSASPSSVPDETFSPSQGVDLSLSMEEDTELSMVDSTCDKPASFEYIGKAVTSAPRCKDVNNPSWHEKILMYDPIILEDLTAWLNCGPLTKVGYDDEVSSGEVKKWCESKSICCLWKVNLRGKERKRY
ncbi:AT hook, DNA-binding protein [Cordyceps militaris CM01]|uniref:Structure-specific endonuclease subunit SLX4 n=1 Tax=Cordyceps militaris (strain CM01) TaxID=983644 RepID=G3J7M9_CORMM|nr:AT hook, DNA-binding protein [Cordyceps militaris CM01]EGX95495.1 AT hook, DNA-binding protein [Cordyceps militaris CM01]